MWPFFFSNRLCILFWNNHKNWLETISSYDYSACLPFLQCGLVALWYLPKYLWDDLQEGHNPDSVDLSLHLLLIVVSRWVLESYMITGSNQRSLAPSPLRMKPKAFWWLLIKSDSLVMWLLCDLLTFCSEVRSSSYGIYAFSMHLTQPIKCLKLYSLLNLKSWDIVNFFDKILAIVMYKQRVSWCMPAAPHADGHHGTAQPHEYLTIVYCVPPYIDVSMIPEFIWL